MAFAVEESISFVVFTLEESISFVVFTLEESIPSWFPRRRESIALVVK